MSLTLLLKRFVPAPIKRIMRGHILTKITTPWLATAQLKEQSLQRHAKTIETLVLGSSHGEFGFTPNPTSFNLCLSSQDLYYSYQLYQKYASHLPKLHNVVLFYSVFSPGFDVGKTSESERCSHYKVLFGIPYRNRPQQFQLRQLCMQRNAARFLKRNHPPLLPDYRGEGVLDMAPPTSTELEKRIAAHFKHNQRNNQLTDYVSRLHKLTQSHGHTLTVVIAPCQPNYTQKLPPADVLFADLISRSDAGFQLLNFFTDTHFTPADFVDSDHLNSTGSAKLTAKILPHITHH